jgi:hypothetical protein
MSQLTLARLKELMTYDPQTGHLYRRVGRGNTHPGRIAGGASTDRGLTYRLVQIDGRRYKAHRLVWFYVHGRWPRAMIDHIDGNGLNNALANLREANHAENGRNRGANTNSKSGIKGVRWHARTRKWVAEITVNRAIKYLGCFEDQADACAAYRAAAEEHHGEFARVA